MADEFRLRSVSLAMVVSITIGTAVGTISGYFGGKLDNFLMRVVEVLMSIPSFF